jgi:Ca-activated chloride channel homolog
MRRKAMLSLSALLFVSIVGLVALAAVNRSRVRPRPHPHVTPTVEPLPATAADKPAPPTPGALQIVDREGKPPAFCPLRHTSVKAEVSGFIARATVTQEFENRSDAKIEAVYTFPLPQNAAVDDMTMLVGDRTVKGKIKKRDEAKQIYEQARQQGHVASLLDQERPNIFTQSVTNIMPGERVKVTISYVETLKYEDGAYEFVFPMVVGPRYIPGQPVGKQGGGWAPDTNRVSDGSRITPPVTPQGTRAGHDISIEVALDAGLAIDELKSKTHEVEVEHTGNNRAVVRLKNRETIPNKDFILRYDVAGKKIGDAVLTHRGPQGGFFTLMLQPPERVVSEEVTPKEIVFVIDTSGSMHGFPLDKAKEAMKMAIDGLHPRDTFNLITFSGDTHILFPAPVPATPENLQRAQAFLASRSGGGGTEMMKAIRAALDPSDSQEHVRVVCFMTDGYVGNDLEIVSEIKKHPNARVFSFGIGSSVNRFLLDKMAEAGRGEVEYVGLNDDGSAAAKRFHERVRSPLLTDISIDWNGLPVADVLPSGRIPDLFSAKPLALTGRFTAAAKGAIKLKGKVAGRAFVREIAVEFPESEARHDVLSTLWARRKVDDLMMQADNNPEMREHNEALREQITGLGLNFRLMTQYTSFVAVEEKIITDGTTPRRVEVPVEMPEGVSYEGVFGKEREERQRIASPSGFGRSNRALQMAPGVAMSETVTVTGDSARISTEARPSAARPLPMPTPAPKRKDEAAAQSAAVKLHPSISALVERLKNKGSQASADEARFVSGGKAEVQIWLVEKSPASLAELKKLGFEVTSDPPGSKLVIGRVAVEKLAKLTELPSVRYVAPYLR